MPCHVLKPDLSRNTYCGVDFSKLEEPHPHTYVEKKLEMADCPECLRLWHKSELDRLDGSPWAGGKYTGLA